MNPDEMLGAKDRVLVTGASGFIGSKVVEVLLAKGYANVRCFVRPSSRLDRLKDVIDRSPSGGMVELVIGDLLSSEDCKRAVDGAAIIHHLAAGFDKSFAGAFMNSALATRNLIEAALETGSLKRFVNVSSFAVYSNLGLKWDALMDENCPLENSPQERFDAYGFGKLKQEEIVKQYGDRFGLSYVILRPGMVFGPGKRDLSGRVGIDMFGVFGIDTFGVFIQVGGSNLLPLTFVDNCADAIVLAGLRPGVDGEVFNVVDDDLLTSREFLRAYQKRVKPFRAIQVPYSVAYVLSRIWEEYSRKSKGQLPPAFNRRRCSAEWKRNRFSNQKLRDRLGWRPRIGTEKAMALFLEQFEPKK